MRFPHTSIINALTLNSAVMNSDTEVNTVEAELMMPRYSFTIPEDAAVKVMKGCDRLLARLFSTAYVLKGFKVGFRLVTRY